MTTQEKLVNATISLWMLTGNARPSMRAILARSDATPPSLYHHFTSLYHLYHAAHEAAVERAEWWCAARLAELDTGTALDPAALPPLMACLIDEWCRERRELAFAHFLCLAETVRGSGSKELALRWETLWREFWQAVADRCGLPDAGTATASLAVGLDLAHLLRTRRTIDRCWLDEICRAWGDWNNGRLAADSQWHLHAMTAARYHDAPPELPEGKALAIANAAADVLIDQGAHHIAHRTVAAHAGVSTGSVSYHCRTVDDLLRAAFAALYWRAVKPVPEQADGTGAAMTRAEAEAAIASGSVPPGPDRQSTTGWIELHLALARDPDLASLAARVRYRGGHVANRYLHALLPGHCTASLVDRALLANWIIGSQLQTAVAPIDIAPYRASSEWLTAMISGLRGEA